MTVERAARFASLPTLYFEDLAVGQSASLVRTVADMDVYGLVEPDEAPVDGEAQQEFYTTDFYADRLRFGQYIAHGVFTSGLVAAIISTRLPGISGVYLSQTFQYIAPVRIGDTITARVEIMELVYPRRRVRLFCECLRDGSPVLEGEAWIAVLPRPDASE